MGTSRLEALSEALDERLTLAPGDLDDDELHDVAVGFWSRKGSCCASPTADPNSDQSDEPDNRAPPDT